MYFKAKQFVTKSLPIGVKRGFNKLFNKALQKNSMVFASDWGYSYQQNSLVMS